MTNSYLMNARLLLNSINFKELDDIASIILDNYLNGGRTFVLGNGGSAYSASHFAQDLVKACSVDAESLTDNVGLVTALSNDISFESIFVEQLKVKARSTDILFVISCSGNSKNILNACGNCFVISLTAFDGGELAKVSNVNINVPTNDIYLAEGIHSLILHYIIERTLEWRYT